MIGFISIGVTLVRNIPNTDLPHCGGYKQKKTPVMLAVAFLLCTCDTYTPGKPKPLMHTLLLFKLSHVLYERLLVCHTSVLSIPQDADIPEA